MQSLNVVVAVFATFLAIAHGDNFCRTQSDFQSTAVATGTTTCEALNTFLLGKFNPAKPAWSSVSGLPAVSCSDLRTQGRWTSSGSSTSVWQHLIAFGTTCCGSADKTVLGACDNFCRTQSDFQPNAVATGTTTCLELSTFLLGKFNPAKPAWSSVSCTETWTAAWRDTPTDSIKSIAEHFWTFGTACCGSAHKTLLGNTCHGCENAVPGTVVNRMGWFTATGATTSSAVAPGTVAPAGGGTYCGWSAAPPSGSPCNVSSWTSKKFGDTPAAATHSTCGPCEVIISKSTSGTCDAYCATQGRGPCVAAWDENLDSCNKKLINGASALTCNATYSHDSDIICQCSAPPITIASAADQQVVPQLTMVAAMGLLATIRAAYS